MACSKGLRAKGLEQPTPHTHTAKTWQDTQRIQVELSRLGLILDMGYCAEMCLQKLEDGLAQLRKACSIITHNGTCNDAIDLGNEGITVAILRLIAGSKGAEYGVYRM